MCAIALHTLVAHGLCDRSQKGCNLPHGKPPLFETPQFVNLVNLISTGYSAPLDFSTAPSGCEKSSLLETLADSKTYRGFAAASPNPTGSHPYDTDKKKQRPS